MDNSEGGGVENSLYALQYHLCKVLKHTKQWGILFWIYKCTEVPGCIKEHMLAPGYLVPLRGRGREQDLAFSYLVRLNLFKNLPETSVVKCYHWLNLHCGDRGACYIIFCTF